MNELKLFFMQLSSTASKTVTPSKKLRELMDLNNRSQEDPFEKIMTLFQKLKEIPQVFYSFTIFNLFFDFSLKKK